jgi:hypothetical protein
MRRRLPVGTPLLALAALALALAACGNGDTKLKVTGLDPEKGDMDGGTYVRVHGNGFLANGGRGAKVYFGSHQGTVIRFESDNELIVEAPGGKLGDTVDVLVMFEPGGELKIPHAYTFVEKHDQGPKVEDLNTTGSAAAPKK